ncbi:protein kinase [Clostridium ganghwense]|uniref:Protein kinase n=1 Tax=Clostridium ganghwense TaxID=312089 RepID=A0ABT4CRL8_9CLOT|nr:protein kinase [Clostridium ganghwense]MCY6371723.1 protein kinase [Clostridium ganghwense]
MDKNDSGYIDLDSRAEKMLRKGEFLGCGHNGIVYLLPDKRVIKIFKDKKVCEKEYDILKRARKSKYFPKVYAQGTYYIVRNYVSGERLDKYIKKEGFNKQIAHNIIKLIKEFKMLGFKKLDIRCKDLYVGKHFSLKVIDPKNNYSEKVIYPRHLMKGLNKLGVLDEFLSVVNNECPEIYELWNFRIKQYLDKGIK